MNFKDNLKKKIIYTNSKNKIKKDQRFYENMITSHSGKATEVIFNKTSLSWLIVIVTLLLQLISLATTYKGSIIYFGGIKLPLGLSAPLFFALSIQLIVFCVSHTIRLNFKKGLMIVLIMATLCSTYFSYIGIYNYINSPINYLKERYEQISNNISDKYEIVKENNKGNMTKTMLTLVNEINTKYTSLNMKVEENNKLTEQINNINIDGGVVNSQTSTVSMPNIYNYGDNLDSYYADMAKYNAAIGNMISDSTIQDSTLKNDLYNAEVQAILGGKTQDKFVAESIDTQSKKDQLEKSISNIYELIDSNNTDVTTDEKVMKIKEYCQNYIQGMDGDKDVFTTILLNFNAQTQIINGESIISNLQNQINEFLVINKKDTEIMKSVENLEKIVYIEATGIATTEEVVLTEKNAMELYSLMDSEIKSAAYTLNQISGNTAQIDINDKDYVMHNLYVLPIINLIEKNNGRSMALFCLFFAILIDGLTLIFAIMEGREKTPLLAKTTKEVIGTSKESMESLLIVSLLAGDTSCRDKKRVENILLRLQRFIKEFNLLTETLENGYSMYCPISKLEDYQVFLATLCQFNLGTIVSSKEVFFNNPTENEESFVLIKSKFVVWANEKIVSLTLNTQYIDSLNSIDENYVMNGELL